MFALAQQSFRSRLSFNPVSIAALVLVIIYIFVTMAALRSLKTRQLDDTQMVVWMFVVLFIPIIGGIVLFTMGPPRSENSKPESRNSDEDNDGAGPSV